MVIYVFHVIIKNDKHMKYILLKSLVITIVLSALTCKSEVKPKDNALTANTIINKAIEVAGGQLFNKDSVLVNFNFRGNHKEKY